MHSFIEGNYAILHHGDYSGSMLLRLNGGHEFAEIRIPYGDLERIVLCHKPDAKLYWKLGETDGGKAECSHDGQSVHFVQDQSVDVNVWFLKQFVAEKHRQELHGYVDDLSVENLLRKVRAQNAER